MKTKNEHSEVSTANNRTLNCFQLKKQLVNIQKPNEFTIKIANTLEDREAVFCLGYQKYKGKGFTKENRSEWLIENHDADTETVILFIKDNQIVLSNQFKSQKI